ncbi:hypothetical protein Q8F55_005347 [Vanrija albida]|uniref:Pentacotripeptide-repeat region of PRORP domain-containing protein n=1 Tax=Vanrija albida TaxID=181172 RepID=A0ABR3Q1E2_9TREE
MKSVAAVQRAASVLGRSGVRRPRMPPGPSCSRWFSCSCCRPQPASARGLAPTTPRHSIPPLPALQHMRMATPHLPLPPPLPYSPDSQPFLRHLQILSLALLSSNADESWDIYQALHPDLRPAIPDDVFVSLVTCQIQGSGNRLPRLVELLGLARSCDMNPAGFGTNTLERGLVYALRYLQNGSSLPDGLSHSDTLAVIDWLWDGLITVVGDRGVRDLSLDLRRRIVRLGVYRHEHHQSPLSPVRRLLEYLVDNGGAKGMRNTAVRVILAYTGNSPEEHKASLRLAAWSITREVDISPVFFRTLIDRLRASHARRGDDGLKMATEAVEELLVELRQGRAHEPAAVLHQALVTIQKNHRSPLERASDTAMDPQATMPEIHRAAQRVLAQPATSEPDLKAAVQLCIRSLPLLPDADNEALLKITVRQLAQPPLNPALIIRFTQAIIDSTAASNQSIPPPILNRVFNLVAGIVHSDDDAYRLARHIYPIARATSPRQKWNRTTAELWRALFTVSLRHGHITFASRLYDDFVADGQPVFRKSALDFIRHIAQSSSKSRWVLLDRHIKDYLWYHPTMTEDLVVAVAEGLGVKGAADVAVGVRICRRIQPALPAAAVTPLVYRLARSSKPEHRDLAFELLSELPHSPESTDAYNLALSALADKTKEVGLDLVLRVYQDMIGKGLTSSAATVSPLIRALLSSDKLDYALSVFDAAVENGHAARSADVGRLMIHLALAARTNEAEAVELKWRSLFPDEPAYDKAVYGASLVVDILAGGEPDLTVFSENAEGRQLLPLLAKGRAYRPTRPFYSWLTTLQRDRGAGSETAEAKAEAEGRENLTEASLGPLPSNRKAGISPMTRAQLDVIVLIPQQPWVV